MSDEPVFYMEAANGLTVRVPQSKLDAWQKRQNEIKAEIEAGKTPTPDSEMVAHLRSLLEKR